MLQVSNCQLSLPIMSNGSIVQSDPAEPQNRPQSIKWFDDIPTHSVFINAPPGLVSCSTISRCVLGARTLQGEPRADLLLLLTWRPGGRLLGRGLSFSLHPPYVSLTPGSREEVHGPLHSKKVISNLIIVFTLKGKHGVWSMWPWGQPTWKKFLISFLHSHILPGQQRTHGNIPKREK